GLLAVETDFYLPSAVRPGPDGLVHVMDFNNMRLRRIDAAGRVETLAGNGLHALADTGPPAVHSPLDNPIDFAFAADGQVVVLSYHDPRVLRLGAEGRRDA